MKNILKYYKNYQEHSNLIRIQIHIKIREHTEKQKTHRKIVNTQKNRKHTEIKNCLIEFIRQLQLVNKDNYIL